MKQYFLIVCCLFLWLSDSAQDNATFILKGKIKGKPHGKIFINYFNGNSVYYRDTAEIQRGQFHFKGYINEPVRATLFIPDESAGKNRLNELEFYIEPGEITIQVTLNAYNNAIIEGSLSQKEWQQYLSTYDSIELKWKTLLDSLILAKESGNDLLVEKLWEERMPFYQKEVDDNVFFFLRSNRNSFISPDLLTPYLHRLPLDTIKSFYTFFTERVQVSRKGKFIYDFILKEEKVAIGTVIPNLSFMDMNGKSYELLSLRGRYVLLDFWASWCVPCRKETPYHLEVYKKYRDRGFEIVSFSIDLVNEKNEWLKATQQDSMTWVQVCDFKGWRSEIIDILNLFGRGIPSNFLIDPNGKIIARDLRGNELAEILREEIH